MKGESVILFHSSNYAMWAADVLKKADIEYKLIPVPRDLSSDCGYCVRINSDIADRVSEILVSEKIEFDRIVKI